MPSVKIITYTPAYRQHFIDMNMEWLQKYFVPEQHDTDVFNNLEELILIPGGQIFFCLYNNEVAGTVAMQKIDDTTFELAKMAVTEKYKGKGLSNLLLENCIQFAKKKNITKVILLSNTALEPAINLYRKFGFKEVPLGTRDYARANIQMELVLK